MQYQRVVHALFLLSVIFVLSLTKVSGQGYYDYYEREMRLGLVFNPSVNWLRYENAYTAPVKMGFSYGLQADLGFARNYFLSTGLLINSINTRVETTDAAYPSRDVFLRYAEVPLAIKLKTNPTERGRLYGQFGFTLGVKVSGREQLDGAERRQEIDGDDLFRLGLQIGTGYEWNLGSNLGLLTGISFNNGFTRAVHHAAPYTSFVALNFGLLF